MSILKSLVSVTVIALISLSCWAQSETSGAAAGNAGPPKIKFENTTHNFGKVSPKSKSECEFKFCNAGGGTLKIKEVSKTCGCTVFSLEKDEYAAGECGTLKVQYTADAGRGPRTRRLFVYSNDPENEKVQLVINATIMPKIEYTEKLSFALKDGKEGTDTLKLKSIDDQPFSIKSMTSTNNAVIMDFDPEKKATEFELKARLDAEKAGNATSGRIELVLTHPECDRITVGYSVLPRYQMQPPSINVLNAEPNVPVKKELWLLNNYGEDFEVDSTAVKNGHLKVEDIEKVGKRYKLTLEILPPETKSRARIINDNLDVKLKDGTVMDVQCRVFYKRERQR
jgi:hypothetical protein